MSRKAKLPLSILITAAALTVSAALLLSACGKQGENVYSLSEERAFSISNLDEVVDEIRNALKERSKSITIDLSLKGEYMDDISPLVQELMDLAELYTGAPDEGDYLKYQMGGYTYSYGHKAIGGGFRYTITITPEYFSTKKQEEAVAEKTEEIINGLSLPEKAGEAEKIRAVYEYLAENVAYDSVHKNNEYYKLKSTAYGALVNGSSTCQGYAVSMYRLLLELGVECHVITGEGLSASGSEAHAWNLVRIGDLYYYVDPTWNDLVKEEDYYLKGSEDFPDHIPDEEFSGLYPVSESGFRP